MAKRTVELRAASERLLAATSAANVGTWDWDVEGDSLVWDEVMYRLYGLTPEQFSGASEAWRSAIHPDDAQAAYTAVEQAILGRADFDIKFRIVTPSGLVRHLHAVASVHRDPAGKPLKLRGVNWDISAEVIAQDRLRTNEALLREFITHTPAAIAMLDRELRYVQASRRWINDYKLIGQDIIGRSHYEVFPDIPDRWKQIHQRVLAGAVESCDEDPFPREDGGMEWLQWEARPWYESTGSIGGIVFFTQVITERKELGLRLEEQNRQLTRSNDELEQFAYVASHDLQEPLRAIAGCTQILSKRYKGQLDEAADTLVEHIVDGAARMKALIDDLLRLSRSGSEQQALHPVDTAEVFRQALKNLDASIKEQGALVSAGPLPIVRGDSTQLLQLFQNLLGEGQRHRHRLPLLRACFRRLPTPSHPRRIPRHRHRTRHLPQDRRAPPRPHLARVQPRQRHDLPLHPARPMNEAAMTDVPVDILLVEDSPSDQLLAREALAEAGVKSRLHIVCDGIEVLSEIKSSEDLKRIPVVVLTTSESEQDVKRAYALHANCYVSKPVDFEAFKRVIRSIEEFWFRTVRLPSSTSGWTARP